ncbi:acylglycerol kinase, mitochondrial-like isoform X1 [Aphidius gifuensis]|uniref:acylglycerol kinase, mitochondrial-like isoform X1 n=1 Tax=Aphidius gifuensis TaxID=684658 RepID=UPI001CDC6251|nr:acylglycerol kinase, mitochondrial-like isoform X1 [Aphidius gifuensis]
MVLIKMYNIKKYVSGYAIDVAGSDGTLSDVLTGLMRKYNGNSAYSKQFPIGILPLGETNRTANHLFNKKYDNLLLVHQLADATIATMKGSTKYIDVVELESLENPDPENPIKPIYAVGQIEWGAWGDANAQKDKYWYLRSLRRYASFVFCRLKNNLNWRIDGTLKYTDPCSGCSRCYQDNRNLQNITSSVKEGWRRIKGE